MRRRNWRMIIGGFIFLTLAIGFFLFMMSIAPQSTDPVTMMQTVGQASGVLGSVSLIMIVVGFIGKKT